MIYYFDSSGLVKRYVQEIGSGWVRKIADSRQNLICIAEIAKVEVASAFARQSRSGAISPNDADTALEDFLQDWETEYRTLRVNTELVDKATLLVRQHTLRAYDAVHLAAALATDEACRAEELPPVILVSADVALNAAARAERLRVEDPNHHP